MTSNLEQHMHYLTSNLEYINDLLNEKLNELRGPDTIEYLKQEKYLFLISAPS